MTISAILFDFDGTISDSERFHFNCWNETLADYDVILDWDFYITEFAGIPTPQTAKLIAEKFCLSVTPDVLAKQNQNRTAQCQNTYACINALCGKSDSALS